MADEPQRIIVPKERTFEREQGCWNCKHWDTEAAVKKWSADRQGNLNKALNIAIESPNGEADTRVYNIRGMVDRLDHEIARGSAGVCHGKGRLPDGNPVGDFVVHNYLCDRWSGRQGTSMARTPGKTDKLPEELQEELDGPKPKLTSMPTSGLTRKPVL